MANLNFLTDLTHNDEASSLRPLILFVQHFTAVGEQLSQLSVKVVGAYPSNFVFAIQSE